MDLNKKTLYYKENQIMKHLKKITLFLSVFALLFSISCSKDDEVGADLTEVEFSFDASNPPIDQTIISNLSMLGDNNAATIAGHLSTANGMSNWLSFFQENPNAVQSNTPIGSCGGSALVYTYTASAEGETISIAYQICESTDKYVFQIFVSENGGDFQELIYAEETKDDLRNGYMEIFGADPSDSDLGNTAVFRYTWTEATDGSFEFTASSDLGGYLLTIDVNSDQSGELSYTIDGDLIYEATWNAAGTAGTYTYYDGEGNVEDSGNWPVD